MSSSAITTQVAQLKIGSVQNQADSTSVYSNGQWSFKNSTALTSVTITDSGNVGIGTASPQALLHVNRGTAGAEVLRLQGGTGAFNDPYLSFYKSDGTARNGYIQVSPTDFGIGLNGSGNILFSSNSTERMRIDASGNLLVGTASTFDSGKICSDGASAAVPLACRVTPTTNSAQIYFRNGNGIVGSITTNGSATSFNPSSDERLKENIQPITNGLERVSKLKPVDYTWKSDGRLDNGFIAQDLLKEPEFEIRVNPIGKTEDGEEMFGVDYMKFVAVLTAAIQELSAKNDALEARLAALESK